MDWTLTPEEKAAMQDDLARMRRDSGDVEGAEAAERAAKEIRRGIMRSGS